MHLLQQPRLCDNQLVVIKFIAAFTALICTLWLLFRLKQSMLWLLIPLLLYLSMQQQPAREVLLVQNFIEYIPQQIIEDFEAETGIQIVYNIIPDNDGSILDLQMLMNSASHDIVLLSLYKARSLFELGLIKTIPQESITEIPYDMDIKLLSAKQPGNFFCIPYVCGTLGVAYNRSKVLGALGQLPTDPLSLVFDHNTLQALHNAGLIISIADAPLEILPSLAIYIGYNLDKYDDTILQAIYKHLLSLRKFYNKIHLTLYMRDIDSNCADVVLGWSTFLTQAVLNNPKFVMHKPTENITWVDVLCIPKNAKHYANALKFIKFVTRPENTEKIRAQYYGNKTYSPGVNYKHLSIERAHHLSRLWQNFKFMPATIPCTSQHR